ncbi:MAG: aminoacetone oxidase family FAD-binding enzyme, partial [Ruminococcus sp.]
VVISTGSKAAKKLGADASGLDLLRNLGHTVSKLSPALCPIPVVNKKLSALKGIRATGKVTLISNGNLIKSELGEIQFTENALSGICVFNLATFVKDADTILVSLLPELNDTEINELVKKHTVILKNRPIEDLFTGVFQKKLGIYIIKEAIGDSLSRKVSAINDNEINKIAYAVNRLSFKVKKPTDFDKAQVVKGGVLGKEINPNSMESRKYKGLYICGEAIDIDGDCGGYNLQFAFASGFLAGENL